MAVFRVLVLILMVGGCLEAAGRLSCPPGWTSDNGKFPGCVACPLGTYQHRPSRKICRPCPANTTTRSTATISRSECVPPTTSSNSSAPCDAGSYSTTGYQPCIECPVGHYSVNRTTCLSCPSRRTTTSTGATDIKNCTKFRLLEPCPPGLVSASGYQPSCVKCSVGTHQPFEGQRVCAMCPEGSNSTSEGAVNCTLSTTMEDITAQPPNKTFTHIKVDKPEKKPQGVKTVRLVKISGEFSSKNYPGKYPAGTVQHWKIHCHPDELVGVIILNMSLSDGDFLQLRDEQWNGTLDIPRSTVFRKQTVGVLFSGMTGNSTGFEIAFLCIGNQKWSLAESILNNRGIMEIIKEDKIAVKKTIELILNPLALIYGFSDPYQRRILQLHFGRGF